MAARKTPLEKLLSQVDKHVEARGKAVLAEVDATAEIARLTSEARKQGASMPELTQHVRRMDRKTRQLVPVTRQAIDIMLATFEERRKPRTTRASRKRRTAEPAGKINADALR